MSINGNSLPTLEHASASVHQFPLGTARDALVQESAPLAGIGPIESCAKLICKIYDRESSWKPCIESITCQLKVYLEDLRIEPTVYGEVLFNELNIIKDKIAKEEIADLNMLTISFLVSELRQHEAQKIFLEIFDKISPGCLLVLIDNTSGDAHIRFDSIVNEYNYLNFTNYIKIIRGEQKTFKVDWREEKEDLEPYWSKLNWFPRLTLPVYYRIYLKA